MKTLIDDLHEVIFSGNFQKFENKLIKYQKYINAINDRGRTIIYYVTNNHETLLSLLYKYNIDINHRDKIGMTPLMSYVIENCIVAVKSLCYQGANINIKSDRGCTALIHCCESTNT